MNIKSVYSDKTNIEEIIKDIKEQYKDFKVKVLIFFASSNFAPDILSRRMKETFPDTHVFGCTTAGEIVSGKMLKNSVVAMASNSNIISDIKIEVLENIKGAFNIKEVFKNFEKHYNESMLQMDFQKYVGIILIDGLCASEERVIDKIGDMTNVIFVGGSAGDDLKFKETYVFANGKAYTNAAVLALLKPAVEFDIIKTQSFIETGKKLLVTKANETAREVIEFNKKHAAIAYAEAVGMPIEDAHNRFICNPVGLIIDGQPYVRSPLQMKGNSIIFACNILEGMEVSLLESTDIVKDTKEAIENKNKEWGKISGLINFHCTWRTLELEKNKKIDEYGKIFTDIPTIGFSTYGEQYLGHLNHTSTILVFK